MKSVEWEIGGLDEVMKGQGDFCALVDSRGTTASLDKVGCSHLKTVSKPNFDISQNDIAKTSIESSSVANRFIMLIWTKGG